MFGARGRVFGIPAGARGVLDPQTGRAEVSVSDVHSETRGVRLPPKVRVYNTPSGELDVTLSSDVTLPVFGTVAGKGTYVIGRRDPKAKK
jgi:hypothetical protein